LSTGRGTAEQRRRLRWRCRRGMRELDALLMRYVDERYAEAPRPEQVGFETLLCLPDPEILGLLTGRQSSHDAGVSQVVSVILAGSIR
jgi:antitoxin CptB